MVLLRDDSDTSKEIEEAWASSKDCGNSIWRHHMMIAL
ncbi:hypothetical protein SGODD07_00830 [Streptococcus gordonii]|uniref:Uncharacterized protein n=1 Tax=Streptococcus gordonii TaxID=1302 RepID=A0A139N8S9_STRGN|nr:hypothetical protein SGODD07_00830 [Streptococcus gordonii]